MRVKILRQVFCYNILLVVLSSKSSFYMKQCNLESAPNGTLWSSPYCNKGQYKNYWGGFNFLSIRKLGLT